MATSGSITNASPTIPESKDFWESPLHVSRIRYPDFGIYAHGLSNGGWDYELGWDDSSNSSLAQGLYGQAQFSYAVALDPNRQYLHYGDHAVRCKIAAASTIGSDTGFWILDNEGPRITSFEELNSGIRKGTEFQTQQIPELSKAPGNNCETCVEAAPIRIYDITGSALGTVANNWIGTGEHLEIMGASDGDRFTIYNLAPGSSSITPSHSAFDDGAGGMPSVGGLYSSSYFVYANGILAKRYFDFDIYQTSDNRSDLEGKKYRSSKLESWEAGWPWMRREGYRWQGDSNLPMNTGSLLNQWTSDPMLGYNINSAFSSLERWPYMTADARSQILLKIPSDDQIKTSTTASWTGSYYGSGGNRNRGDQNDPLSFKDDDPGNITDLYHETMTYFVYTEASASHEVKPMYNAKPFTYQSKSTNPATENPRNYAFDEELSLNAGSGIPGYFHTHSTGVGTWMPAGDYTKMEAFAMAITHYSPWFSASYDSSSDTGSVLVYPKQCSVKSILDFNRDRESTNFTSSFAHATQSNIDQNLAYIHNVDGKLEQNKLTSNGFINNIHTIKIAQLHKAYHHDFRLNLPEHYWRKLGSPDGLNGWQAIFSESNMISSSADPAAITPTMFIDSYPTASTNQFGGFDVFTAGGGYNRYAIPHFLQHHVYSASFAEHSGPYRITGQEGNIYGHDIEPNAADGTTITNGWPYDYTASRISPGNRNTMPTSGSYNGTVKGADTVQGYGFAGFRTVVYTASMPADNGYMTASFSQSAGTTFGEVHGHTTTSWGMGDAFNIKYMYYDWNHYNFVLWKGVEIVPSKSYWIEEVAAGESQKSRVSSRQTVQSFIGKRSLSQSNWRTEGELSTTMELNQIGSQLYAPGATQSNNYLNAHMNTKEYFLRERPNDLKINNWGSLNLAHSTFDDNCWSCENHFDSPHSIHSSRHGLTQQSYTSQRLMTNRPHISMQGQYSRNGVTPIEGHQGFMGHLRNYGDSGEAIKNWWKMGQPQSIVMHSGDEISPMFWGGSVTFADNPGLWQRQVKRPTCHCNYLLDWKNFPITPFSPMRFLDEPHTYSPSLANQTVTASANPSFAQYYRLFFSDGYSFTAGPYSRLFSYDPTSPDPNVDVPLTRKNSLLDIRPVNIGPSGESPNWPHKLTSRTVREIVLYSDKFLNNNTAAFIKCSDIDPGTSKVSGFVFLTGIEKVHSGYTWKDQQHSGQAYANLRGLGTATQFNEALYQNHFTMRGTGSTTNPNTPNECGVNLFYGKEVGGTLYPHMTHPRTLWPKNYFSSSIFDGVIMLENGLYVGFESPAARGIETTQHFATYSSINTESGENETHIKNFETKASYSAGMYGGNGGVVAVHKNPYILFPATGSNKKWTGPVQALNDPTQSLHYFSFRHGIGCREDTAFNYDPLASSHSDDECCILFSHVFEDTIPRMSHEFGGDGIGVPQLDYDQWIMNPTHSKYFSWDHESNAVSFDAQHTMSNAQSAESLYGWMTASATGTYSDFGDPTNQAITFTEQLQAMTAQPHWTGPLASQRALRGELDGGGMTGVPTINSTLRISGGGRFMPKFDDLSQTPGSGSYVTNILPTHQNITAGLVTYPLNYTQSGMMSASWMNHLTLPMGGSHKIIDTLSTQGTHPQLQNRKIHAEFMDYDRMLQVGFINLRPGAAGAEKLSNLRFNITNYNQFKFGQYSRDDSDNTMYTDATDTSFDGFKNLLSLDIDTWEKGYGFSEGKGGVYPVIHSRGYEQLGATGQVQKHQGLLGLANGEDNYGFQINKANLQGITKGLLHLKLAGCKIQYFNLHDNSEVNTRNRFTSPGNDWPKLDTDDRIWWLNAYQTSIAGNPNGPIEGESMPTRSLQHLNLEDNGIKDLNLGYLPNLRTAHLASHNNNEYNTFLPPLKSFSSVNLQGCRNLIELDISHNTYYNLDLTKNTKLELLKFQGNMLWTQQTHRRHDVQYEDMRFNEIHSPQWRPYSPGVTIEFCDRQFPKPFGGQQHHPSPEAFRHGWFATGSNLSVNTVLQRMTSTQGYVHGSSSYDLRHQATAEWNLPWDGETGYEATSKLPAEENSGSQGMWNSQLTTQDLRYLCLGQYRNARTGLPISTGFGLGTVGGMVGNWSDPMFGTSGVPAASQFNINILNSANRKVNHRWWGWRSGGDDSRGRAMGFADQWGEAITQARHIGWNMLHEVDSWWSQSHTIFASPMSHLAEQYNSFDGPVLENDSAIAFHKACWFTGSNRTSPNYTNRIMNKMLTLGWMPYFANQQGYGATPYSASSLTPYDAQNFHNDHWQQHWMTHQTRQAADRDGTAEWTQHFTCSAYWSNWYMDSCIFNYLDPQQASSVTPAWLDLTNNRMLKEVIIPGVGYLGKHPANIKHYENLDQSGSLSNTNATQVNTQGGSGTGLISSSGDPFREGSSKNLVSVGGDGVGLDLSNVSTDTAVGNITARRGATHKNSEHYGISGLQFGSLHKDTVTGEGYGTHPHMNTLVASYNFLDEFSTQGFVKVNGTGSLQHLNLECNCLQSASLDISGSGGSSLYSIRLRGNLLRHLDLTDVGKTQRYGMLQKIGTVDFERPTGSVYEMDLSQNLLTDPKMFTSSCISSLAHLDINGNCFEHFPFQPLEGGWQEPGLQSEADRLPGLVTFNAYNYKPAKWDYTDKYYYRDLPAYCSNIDDKKFRLGYFISHGINGSNAGQSGYPGNGTNGWNSSDVMFTQAPGPGAPYSASMWRNGEVNGRIWSGEDQWLFNENIYRNDCIQQFASQYKPKRNTDYTRWEAANKMDMQYAFRPDWGSDLLTDADSPAFGREGMRNNFSQSFNLTGTELGWARYLQHLNVSNCSIEGEVATTTSIEIRNFIAAGNKIESFDFSVMNSVYTSSEDGDKVSPLQVLVAPCQGEPSHSAGYFSETISSGSNWYYGLNLADDPGGASSLTGPVPLFGVKSSMAALANNSASNAATGSDYKLGQEPWQESLFVVPQYEPLARYGNTLTQITMSGKNNGSFEYPDLHHINLEKNISLGYIDLRGIDLSNWRNQMSAYEVYWGGQWPPSAALPSGFDMDNQPKFNDIDPLHDVNKNKFNFYQCASLAQSGSGDACKQFTIRVRNAASKSMIDQYRGTTRQYPFRMNTWATVSFW
tara:strand:+ start:4418 stop:13744 length:9327 start_codon:yes stop_codon:yes gene_type:complete